MKIRIEPYKTWSGGAKALGIRCGILRATKRQVRKHGDFDLIINWGRTERRFNGEYLNDPDKVRDACDKKTSLEILAEAKVSCPDFTADKVLAETWLADGSGVVVRKLLRANSGRGIVFCTPENGKAIPDAPLYTRYEKKAEEYRVHIFEGVIVDVQQKKRKLDVPDDRVDFQIRNGRNGWIFAREDVNAPKSVLGASVDAVHALGLDFGAVDVGYNIKHDKATVYEVNTAPGLEGTTLDNYYAAIKTHYPALCGGMYWKRRRGMKL